MLTGEIRNQIDSIWNDFWAGGLANPLSVMEQITYLLFIKRLDELHTLEERKSQRLNIDMERRIFPKGEDERGRPYDDLRWSRFKHFEAREMMNVVDEHVFPFLRELGSEGSSYGKHMRDARLGFSNPGLLAKVVEKLDKIEMEARDTKGDVYEYMLGKIASAGQNGQFRTPRHIIRLMVELTAPQPTDTICDPASGTCGFLVAAGEFLREKFPEMLRDKKERDHFHNSMFHGFDFDPTMLRIGSMNMTLHGVENPDISYRDSLAEEHGEDASKYSLVLANPPFAGSLDYESTAKDLQRIVKTKKTELLFVALFLRLLKNGGRAAAIVPAGVLESDSKAHESMRKALVEENCLDAIITLPHWIFKPYASVSTAILVFTRGGKTEKTWFYRLENDGFSNDANKTPKSGTELPDIVDNWNKRTTASYRAVPKKHRFVTYEEIIANDYDLCANVYLSGYEYPKGYELHHLDEFFLVQKGNVSASSANDGPYPFITSSEEIRSFDSWSFDSEAICIPIVSSTGHGHASIKAIHYVSGKFEAATITAVLTPTSDQVFVPYVYYYLLAHKDELLVPLMRGAANVSLNLDRLAKLKIPVPKSKSEQRKIVGSLTAKREKVEEFRKAARRAEGDFFSGVERFRSEF